MNSKVKNVVKGIAGTAAAAFTLAVIGGPALLAKHQINQAQAEGRPVTVCGSQSFFAGDVPAKYRMNNPCATSAWYAPAEKDTSGAAATATIALK